jgi:hypothetical protein
MASGSWRIVKSGSTNAPLMHPAESMTYVAGMGSIHTGEPWRAKVEPHASVVHLRFLWDAEQDPIGDCYAVVDIGEDFQVEAEVPLQAPGEVPGLGRASIPPGSRRGPRACETACKSFQIPGVNSVQ